MRVVCLRLTGMAGVGWCDGGGGEQAQALAVVSSNRERPKVGGHYSRPYTSWKHLWILILPNSSFISLVVFLILPSRK